MSAYEAFSEDFVALQAEDASASSFFWLTTYVSIIYRSQILTQGGSPFWILPALKSQRELSVIG